MLVYLNSEPTGPTFWLAACQRPAAWCSVQYFFLRNWMQGGKRNLWIYFCESTFTNVIVECWNQEQRDKECFSLIFPRLTHTEGHETSQSIQTGTWQEKHLNESRMFVASCQVYRWSNSKPHGCYYFYSFIFSHCDPHNLIVSHRVHRSSQVPIIFLLLYILSVALDRNTIVGVWYVLYRFEWTNLHFQFGFIVFFVKWKLLFRGGKRIQLAC